MAPTNFDQAVQTLTHHISIIKSPYNVSRPTQQTLALSLNTHVAPSPNPNKYPPPLLYLNNNTTHRCASRSSRPPWRAWCSPSSRASRRWTRHVTHQYPACTRDERIGAMGSEDRTESADRRMMYHAQRTNPLLVLTDLPTFTHLHTGAAGPLAAGQGRHGTDRARRAGGRQAPQGRRRRGRGRERSGVRKKDGWEELAVMKRVRV